MHDFSFLVSDVDSSVLTVMGKMQFLLDYFSTRREYAGLHPFLYTYYAVTKEVALQMHTRPRRFHNAQALEHLDIYFASLYFEPLISFLQTGSAPKPWHTYFQYCMKKNSIPFVQMLLGINAHINGDLAKTVLNLEYRESGDFEVINEILEAKIPEVLTYLAFQDKDMFGLGGLVFKNFYIEQFKKIIVTWRDDAWENSHNMETKKLPLQEVLEQTESVAKEFISIFDQRYNLVKSPANFKRIRELRVRV